MPGSLKLKAAITVLTNVQFCPNLFAKEWIKNIRLISQADGYKLLKHIGQLKALKARPFKKQVTYHFKSQNTKLSW